MNHIFVTKTNQDLPVLEDHLKIKRKNHNLAFKKKCSGDYQKEEKGIRSIKISILLILIGDITSSN
jgi:hypothetical protein